MNPINSEHNGCSPISSSCVLWQGPNIPCLNLCRGETVSGVVHKLATKLCELEEVLSVNNFDISCFSLTACAPETFEELLNLIIERICELEQNASSPAPVQGVAGCPDCEIEVCPNFYWTSPSGDQMTSMQLSLYVKAIGNSVCQLLDQTESQSRTMSMLSLAVEELQNAPAPELILPEVILTSVDDPVPASRPMNSALEVLDQNYKGYKTSVGSIEDVFKVVQSAPPGINQSDRLRGVGKMSDIDGWNTVPKNQAESLQNLWRVVADMRAQIVMMKHNCCNDTCSAVSIFFSGSIISSTSLRLQFGGTIPGNFIDANLGSSVTIIDANGFTQTVNNISLKSSHISVNQPLTISLTGPNTATDLDVRMTYRLVDPVTGATCENVVNIMVLGTDTCPNLVLTSGYFGVNYSFTWNGTRPIVMTVELWNESKSVMLQSQNINVTSSSPSGSFAGLAEGTEYFVRLRINGGACDYENFTTLSYPCNAPTLNAPTISYADPEGDTNGVTITGWQIEYDTYHP